MPDVTRAYSIADLRRMAERSIPRPIFDFFDGGAEDEVTLRDNRAAFERVRLLPRVLEDVRAPDLSCQILGGPSKLPTLTPPQVAQRDALVTALDASGWTPGLCRLAAQQPVV